VPVTVIVETASGGRLDSLEVTLRKSLTRPWSFKTSRPIQISSRVKVPDRSRPARERTGVLMLTPGCRVVLVLDKVRFPWRVPLPPEEKRGSVGPFED
jgi:hypothetical protein